MNNQTPTPALLSCKNLSHSFDTSLFENISLNLEKSQSIAIVGVSGSGKSTLLHSLSSFLKPNDGTVEVLGKDIYKLSNKELINLRQKTLGIIFQTHYLFKGFSVKENLAVSSMLSNENIDKELLEKFGIAKLLSKSVSDISGGEQQRVSIARVLTKKPKIIFADEPTGNLDNKTSKEVMDVIFEYIKTNNAGLILVTHDLNLANQCDKVYELDNRLVAK
jgi:putative ABC transport system ATP-binding protein